MRDVGLLFREYIHLERKHTSKGLSPLDLQLHVEETGEQIDVPAEVVSHDVGPDFAAGERGMGLRFLEMKPEAQRAIEELYERQLKQVVEKVR